MRINPFGAELNLLKNTINFRLAVVCMAAASVGLSMAIISISKLLLLLLGAAVLLFARRAPTPGQLLKGMCSPVAVMIALAAFAISLLWTVAPQDDALGSLVKYCKLLMVVLLLITIRERREAIYALGWFAAAQVFLLASSWMLFARIPVPWATSRVALTNYSVFSSYLDQGIISAVFAAVCWHLREHAPGRFGRKLAVATGLLALVNVFFVLPGRTAHMVSIALLSIAIMWELPKKYRAIAVMLPFLIASILFFTSSNVRDRLTQVQTEVLAYSAKHKPDTSSGIRLELWSTALETISAHPLAGTGIGSWSTQFNRLEREKNPAHIDITGNGNPHQEFLLWGVQLGIPGILLFTGLLVSMWRDTLKMATPCARALQSTLLALVVSCLFNSSLYDAQIGDFFCVLIGLLLALGRQTLSDPPVPHIPYKQPA
ncbi:MAG: O-antigen polymerase [Polaromonas sp.]|jgi:O-antigen ligase|nr:O-antigen polymerase [Polaromonas sp.]MDB5940406.1 O-antigen polymerase [Polaromonas sp.]